MRTCLFSPSNTGVILRHKFDEELLETVVMVAKNGDVTIVSYARQEEQAILGRWILRPTTSLSARVSIMMVTMISCSTVQ